MPCLLVYTILNASPFSYLPSILPHLILLTYCIALKYFGEIQPSSVILSTSPCASSLYNKRSNNNNTIKTISPHGKDGKNLPIQSQRWEQECIIPVRAVPDIREKEVNRRNPSLHCTKSSQRQEIGHHHQWWCYLSAIPQAPRCFVLCGHECFTTEAGCDGSYRGSISPHTFNDCCWELSSHDRSHLCLEVYNDDTHWRRGESSQYQGEGPQELQDAIKFAMPDCNSDAVCRVKF